MEVFLVFKIHQAGLQVAIHAIEEPAVESACNAIAYALINWTNHATKKLDLLFI